MKRIALVLFILHSFALHSLAQVPYGYAPTGVADNELSALGGNKN